MLKGNKAKIISPQQLKDEPVRALVLHACRLVLLHLVVNPPRRHVPVRQPRRELARVIGTHQAIARVLVPATRPGSTQTVEGGRGEREIEIERETDRQTERERDRQTDRERDRQTQTERETHTHTDRNTQTHRSKLACSFAHALFVLEVPIVELAVIAA